MSAIVHHASLVSTQDEARRLAADGAAHGTLVVAEEQTGGRGRLGRTWFSPAGGSVYLSYVHRSALSPDRLSGATLDVATAVADTLCAQCSVQPVVKWPNDLWFEGRKLAGILTELVTGATSHGGPVLIVGVGVNVNVPLASFHGELANTATSVQAITGSTHRVEELSMGIGVAIGERLAQYEMRGAPDTEAYLRRFPWVGHRASVDGPQGTRTVTVIGVAPDGGLQVRDGDDAGVTVLRSGEISLGATDAAEGTS